MAHLGLVYRCGCCEKVFFSALDANRHFINELKVERYAMPDYGDFGDAVKINGYYGEQDALQMVSNGDYARRKGVLKRAKHMDEFFDKMKQNRGRMATDA